MSCWVGKMKVLDLFSGIGGFSLGLERAGMETVAFCENDWFCQQILKKHWPDVPIYGDIRIMDGRRFCGTVELICGGYPCQPFSIAGKQKGNEDARHLWPEMFRIIKQVKPKWVIAENVEGHIKLGLDSVLNDLESEGFTCWPFIIPACAVGAPHQRNRIWVVAYSEHNGQLTAAQSGSEREELQYSEEGQERTKQFKRMGKSLDVAFANSQRREGGCEEPLFRFEEFSWCENVRSPADLRNRSDIPEPLICRSDDGFSGRVDRLRSLGNAVVPQIPEILGHIINGMKNESTLQQ